jgi:integrase/recombinase XerD
LSLNSLKKVGNLIVRKHTYDIAKLWLGRKTMSKQAKTLTQTEIRRVLDYIATRKHSLRNRAMLMTTYLSGMRVGEVSSLRYSDVVDAEGNIRNEIRLRAEQTKGNEARIVFVNEKLRKELELYIKIYKPSNTNHKFRILCNRTPRCYLLLSIRVILKFCYVLP